MMRMKNIKIYMSSFVQICHTYVVALFYCITRYLFNCDTSDLQYASSSTGIAVIV